MTHDLPYGLPNHVVDALIELFKQHPHIEQVKLYGSRAKGNYRPGSDIDLCLVGLKLTLKELFQIELQIDDLLLPWKVDLTVKHKIDHPALLDHIDRVGQIFYLKAADLQV